jgi:hypothetical protein
MERPPAPVDLAGRLGSTGSLGDRIARILLESGGFAGACDPASQIEKLAERYRKQRRKELQVELARAVASGDEALQERLKQERDSLVRKLHPSAYAAKRP